VSGDETAILTWIKSRYSTDRNCVEVAFRGESVLVRDSKDTSGPYLHFHLAEWGAFVAGVRAGQFDGDPA
jgi:hypothetical protein